MTINVKIESKTEWMSMIWELRKKGLLDGIGIEDITIPVEQFPINVPLNLDCILDMANNPLVKPYRKKINESLTKNILMVKKGLC